ncbi:MAG: YSC84-related protein [Chlamydiota bacterium]|nr:YSC84-related protein [Chlamydiota bacterium]
MNINKFIPMIVLIFIASVHFSYADLQKDIDKAALIIDAFNEIPEQAIPQEVLEHAQGLAIITVAKAGFILSGRVGTGLVIVKTPTGWSAPSAIGTGGGGIGFQIGAQITDFVIVLNRQEAVDAFSQGGNVTLGGNLSVSAGPVGRTAEADVTPLAAVLTYSRSKGVFAGVSLEGTVIIEKKKTNEEFYGKALRAYEILTGVAAPPESASALYQALESYGVSGIISTTEEVVE